MQRGRTLRTEDIVGHHLCAFEPPLTILFYGSEAVAGAYGEKAKNFGAKRTWM
jgi:hypothetical protein